MASRTVFDRLWDILWGLDALYLALILAAGIAWGTFTVGSWMTGTPAREKRSRTSPSMRGMASAHWSATGISKSKMI